VGKNLNIPKQRGELLVMEDALLCYLLATAVLTFNFWVSFALLASFWKEVIEADVSSLGRCGAKGRVAPAGTRLL
jgi:hypothetical protein